MILKELCACGSSTEVDDAGAVDLTSAEPLAFRTINTWRRYHVCSLQRIIPPTNRRPPKHRDWLMAGVGVKCGGCSRLIDEEGPEWWAFPVLGSERKVWAHLDCVKCQICTKEARGNGTIMYDPNRGRFYHPRCQRTEEVRES